MNGKKLVILSIVGLLLVAGLGVAWYMKKQNVVGPRFMQLPVRGIEMSEAKEWSKGIETLLQNDEVLKLVVEKGDYAEAMGFSEEQAIAKLKEVVRVQHDERRNAILIGLSGKMKDSELLDKTAGLLLRTSVNVYATRDSAFREYMEKLNHR